MTKLTKWEKEELLRIYKRNRADNRCNIVKGLTKKSKELTHAITGKIDKLSKELSILKNEKEEILDRNKLSNFEGSSQYTCRVTNLHPNLIKFDKETDDGIQKLIHGEFEGDITK